MGGFVGSLFYEEKKNIDNTDIENFNNKVELISHRGPDDTGIYSDDYIRLGFKRLSIIDLQSGSQPMSYKNERYWIVFDGEIYNYIEIKERLLAEGYEFKTNTDTEVILALFISKGEKAIRDLRGMFAFAIWDKEKKELFAARDPFGIKPFYYMDNENKLDFASEKKSILFGERDIVDSEALHHYFTFQYVPEPYTLSQSIIKLEPGHYLRKQIGQRLEIRSYWEPRFITKSKSIKGHVQEVQNALKESVALHMRSDVPVGAFLSGGIDSSAIVALAKEINPKLKTFTVGFEKEGYSEIDLAIDTAYELNVDHTAYTVTPQEFMEELPKIIWHMDDPVADPAAIPLYFAAREARKDVKVVLSGEGADELFGGYNIYREPQALKWFSLLPAEYKSGLKSFIQKLPKEMKGTNYIERGCTPLEDRYVGNAKIYNELDKSKLLRFHNPSWDYKKITEPIYKKFPYDDDVQKMQYIDIYTWLRGDILVKADRMTMAHSLELRVPFLDQNVFNAASKIPLEGKVAKNTTKYVLRKAMEGFLPPNVVKRKKLGFPVPIKHWLKDELNEWALQLIKESDTDDLFNKSFILEQLENHCLGKEDNSRKVWTVLMFMLWHQVFIEKIYPYNPIYKTLIT